MSASLSYGVSIYTYLSRDNVKYFLDKRGYTVKTLGQYLKIVNGYNTNKEIVEDLNIKRHVLNTIIAVKEDSPMMLELFDSIRDFINVRRISVKEGKSLCTGVNSLYYITSYSSLNKTTLNNFFASSVARKLVIEEVKQYVTKVE